MSEMTILKMIYAIYEERESNIRHDRNNIEGNHIHMF